MDIERYDPFDGALGFSLAVRVFGSTLPASAMVGVDRLVDPRFLVEIQAIAYRSN